MRRTGCRFCAASCTTRRPAGWAASPATRACSAPPPTCRASAGCCWTAARSTASRVLSPPTVARMTRRRRRPACATSAASAGTSTRRIRPNRGELFPIGSFGHTGFTGTSLWIDPARAELRHLPVEPRAPGWQRRRDAAPRPRRDDRRGGRAGARPIPAEPLRRVARGCSLAPTRHARAATAQPIAARRCSPASTCSRAENFARLRGRRVGLLTNQTGRVARRREHDRPAARRARTSRSSRSSAPSTASAGVLDEKSPRRATRRRACRSIRCTATRGGRPTPCCTGIDTIVIDLQDVGARFYTYMTTMAYVLEEAAARKLPRGRARPAEPDRRLRRSKGRCWTPAAVGSSATCRCRSGTG